MGNQDPTEQGHAGSVRGQDTLDRTWLTCLQQKATMRRVREDQVYPVTQKTRKGKTRARLGLESLVVPLVPPGQRQYLYNGGISSVDFTCNSIPPN